MAQKQAMPILSQLRWMARTRDAEGVSDAELLERFVSSRDEAAFELLVWRHGGMVTALCQRMLSRPEDRDDAIQATFLTLVAKADSIAIGQSVGSWLYKVAYRIAVDLRSRTGKHASTVGSLEDAPSDVRDPQDIVDHRELCQALDEEIHALPERQREPFLLCYLEGRTNEEAARELGCSIGTIFSRLSRGRERLRAALQRRGIAPSVGAFVAISEESARASVPLAQVGSILQMARQRVKGGGACAIANEKVAQLAEEAIRSLKPLGLKPLVLLVTAGLLCAMAMGVAASTFFEPTAENRNKKGFQAGPPPTAPKTDLQKIQGYWKVVKADANGKHLPKEVSTDQYWSIQGNRITIRYQDASRASFTFKVQSKRKPKAIDLEGVKGLRQGQKAKGIYVLKGDRLDLCFTWSSAGRPTAFDEAEIDRGRRWAYLQRTKDPQGDRTKARDP